MKSLIIVPFLIGSLPLLGSVAIGYNYLKSKKDSKYLYWGGMSGFIIAGCVASNMIMNRYTESLDFDAESFAVDVIHRKDGIEVGHYSMANEYQCGECDSVYDNSSDATICCKCPSCHEPIHEGDCIKYAEGEFDRHRSRNKRKKCDRPYCTKPIIVNFNGYCSQICESKSKPDWMAAESYSAEGILCSGCPEAGRNVVIRKDHTGEDGELMCPFCHSNKNFKNIPVTTYLLHGGRKEDLMNAESYTAEEDMYFVFEDGTTMMELEDADNAIFLQWKIPYSQIRDYVNKWTDDLKKDQEWRLGDGPYHVAYDFAHGKSAPDIFTEPFGEEFEIFHEWAKEIEDAVKSRIWMLSDNYNDVVDLDDKMTKAEIRSFLTGIPTWKLTKRAESHAYSYAYNEGHSDSRKEDGYNPIKSKQDLLPFKRVLKQKGAESFSASGSGDLTYEGGRMVSIEEVTIVDYNWHTDPDETDDIDSEDIESQVQEKVENEMYDGDSGNDSWSYGTDSDGTNVEVYYEWNKTVEDGGEEFIKGW